MMSFKHRHFYKDIILMAVRWYLAYSLSYRNNAALEFINLQLFILAIAGLSFFKIQIRQIKYLNNIVEQDHRAIKRITKPMMGFKAFHSAKSTIAGMELHHMLKKWQHKDSANQSVFEQFYALAA